MINKSLTVRGVSSGQANAAILVAPAGGVVANATSLATGAPIATQVLVQNALAVNLSNLVVDGNNNGISSCSPRLIGIYYQNSSGVVNRVAVLNEVLSSSPVDLTGCQSGLGVFVQSGAGGASTVAVQNSNVQNYQKNGITGNEAGTTVTFSGNTVVGRGAVTGAAENSLQIGFGATGKITSNIAMDDVWGPDVFGDTGNAAAGILVYAAPNVTVSNNTVGNTQFGIAFVSDLAFAAADFGIITANKVTTTRLYDGIDLCSNNNTVQSNTISGTDEAAIHIDTSCTGTSSGNYIAYNTINNACAGIMTGTGAGANTTNPNTYFNVTTMKLNADQCTPALMPVRTSQTTGSARYQPARP